MRGIELCRVRPTTLHKCSNSGACALEPGAYINPVEKPAHPAASESSRMPAIGSNWSAIGVPCPARKPQSANSHAPPTKARYLSMHSQPVLSNTQPRSANPTHPCAPKCPIQTRAAPPHRPNGETAKTHSSHHFQRYALLQLLFAALQHLQIRVAMNIDKSGRHRQSLAIDRLAIRLRHVGPSPQSARPSTE